MNRQRFLDRLVNDEGSERCQDLALALAQICDSQFLEALIQHKGALDSFGGQLYIAAARHKFDGSGNPVEHNEPGSFETVGYVVHYGHKAQLRGQETEPDVAWGSAEVPVSENGSEEPEPAPVASE